MTTHASAKAPLLARTIADLRETLAEWTVQGQSIGFVPTMGALHRGHLSLVETAQEMCDRTIVSIYVNPTQFGPNEDFSTYPRQEADDIAKLTDIGADLVFIPTTDEIYPGGFATHVSVSGITDVLCGTARPGHFDGVATIVTKLLQLTSPDVAVFGEKDYQQLMIIRRLVADLNIPVRIIGGETAREADGLAISSRNAYLDESQRKVAAQLNQILRNLGDAIKSGTAIRKAEADGAQALLNAGFESVDYLEVRDADTLERIDMLSRPARVLAAAHIGKTRLIDNRAIDAKA